MSEVPADQIPGRSQHDARNEQAAAAGDALVAGATGAPTADQQATGDGLDGLTKDQLLEEAEARGVEVKTSSSKDDILKALRAG